MSADTTTPSYWLNWRFFLCALFLFIAMVLASLLILKYEGCEKDKTQKRRDDREEAPGILYEDETWGTCWKTVHPAWLLSYRLIAFILLLTLLVANLAIDGGGIIYFYTQWTFALVTVYFGFGSSLSIYGFCKGFGDDRDGHVGLEVERGRYVAPSLEGNLDLYNIPVNLNYNESNVRKIAGMWGYAFQIVFQICGGAVALTDSVYWFIIYPFLTPKSYGLNFLKVGLHTINAIILLGEMILNRLRFPLFRFAYFALWTSIFVIFQWIIHACVSMWWPYPFLDLSSSYAPLWYLSVGLIQIPCFGIFATIVRVKQFCLSRLS